MLEDFGIPVTGLRTASESSETLDAAKELGFPLALKTATEGIDHKADVDGVRLGLKDLAEVRRAYEDVSRRLGERVIIQRMAPAGVELALGCVVDADFGPLMMVGSGGTLVELLSDRRFALCPFGRMSRAPPARGVEGLATAQRCAGKAALRYRCTVSNAVGFLRHV